MTSQHHGLSAATSDPPLTLDTLLSPDAQDWLATATARIAADPDTIQVLFPAAARRCGRPTADAVRAALLLALPQCGDELATTTAELYRRGDPSEQRAVLRALPLLEDNDPSFGDLALPLVHEALRTNDTTLVEAALGSYATRHLKVDAFRQAVLKCVFCEIPLDRISGLPERADGELARMLADFARERTAAGQPVPSDIEPLIRAFPAPPIPEGAA
ncbi:EboA domain-containing protein [Streptomyces sp. R21]|uniref:EboA domain-containing protein n=1 Tax=Streptomyces sp. R21 TaxID=3238627 RepID=A0AB39PI38_9ACTN